MRKDGTRIIIITTTLLILAAVREDLRSFRISNRLIVFGLAAGIGTWCCMPSQNVLQSRVTGMVIPIIVCGALFYIRALGAADIKLFAVIGCLNGSSVVCRTMAASFAAGAVYALVYLIRRRALPVVFYDLYAYAKAVAAARRALPYPGRKEHWRRMHFSVAIMAGYLMALLPW